MLVSQLVMLYLEQAARPRLKAGSLREVERHLLRKAKSLHPLNADAVERTDIARLLTQVARKAPVQASRARASLAAMFAWAVAQGLVVANPVVGTAKPARETPRDRALSMEELADVWRHSGDGAHGAIVKMLLLTAARRGEVGEMMPGELGPDGLWTVPAGRSKNRSPIERMLPMAARQVLREWQDQAPRKTRGPKRLRKRDEPVGVFGCAEGAVGYRGWSREKALLDARIAQARTAEGRPAMEPWVLHDLRRSVVTQMGELGLAPPHVVEALLGHRHEKVGSVHAVYNRARYRAEVAAALTSWAAQLIETVEGGGASAVVVPLHRRVRPLRDTEESHAGALGRAIDGLSLRGTPTRKVEEESKSICLRCTE